MKEGITIAGILVIIFLLILIPIIATIIVGMWIANQLGLTGIVWWSFMVLFCIFVLTIISCLRKLKN